MERLKLDAKESQRILAPLGNCPLFRSLPAGAHEQIAKAGEPCRYENGETLLRKGEPADSFLVILEGEVAILAERDGGDPVEVGRMPAGSSVGEIGLLLGEARTASVRAAGEVLVLRFGTKAFDAMYAKVPGFGAAIARSLAHRLSEVTGGAGPTLPEWDASKGMPAAEVLRLLPTELCQRHRILPLSLDGNVLSVGFLDEPTTAILSAIRENLPALEIRPLHLRRTTWDGILRSHGGVEGWSGSAPRTDEVLPGKSSPKLDVLLRRMVAEGASDLHLAARHRPHWRIDGDIMPMLDVPELGAREVYELVEPLLDDRNRREFEEMKDADFAYAIPGLARFRVNLYNDLKGVGAAFRLIPSTVLTLEQLSLPPVLADLCDIPKGLILVTGPTGSGKSTTLAAMVDYIIRTKKAHIVTLEDPVEFVHRSGNCLVTQRELGGNLASFGRGLRAALREDPDIVLLGEMRDPETIMLALETANTGHLVLATLHTNSAISAIDRIIDQFPGEQQPQVRTVLADVLRGVVAQILVKKIGGGRQAACEVLVVNLAVANLIREDKAVQITSIMQANRAAGMSLLNDELGRMVDAKKIDMQEALSKALDKADLERRYRTGLTIAEDPPARERLRVTAVQPASPASEAGFQRGDYILEINEKPAKEFDVEEARILLRMDSRHQLTLERAGKRVKLTFDLSKKS